MTERLIQKTASAQASTPTSPQEGETESQRQFRTSGSVIAPKPRMFFSPQAMDVRARQRAAWRQFSKPPWSQ